MFPTDSLRFWSMGCMLLGPVQGICTFLAYMWGFCYFSWYPGFLSFFWQQISMGFYQVLLPPLSMHKSMNMSPTPSSLECIIASQGTKPWDIRSGYSLRCGHSEPLWVSASVASS